MPDPTQVDPQQAQQLQALQQYRNFQAQQQARLQSAGGGAPVGAPAGGQMFSNAPGNAPMSATGGLLQAQGSQAPNPQAMAMPTNGPSPQQLQQIMAQRNQGAPMGSSFAQARQQAMGNPAMQNANGMPPPRLAGPAGPPPPQVLNNTGAPTASSNPIGLGATGSSFGGGMTPLPGPSMGGNVGAFNTGMANKAAQAGTTAPGLQYRQQQPAAGPGGGSFSSGGF